VWSLKPSGKAHYAYMLKNHVLPALGEFLMRDVGPQHIYNLVRAKLDSGLSVQTVTHIRNTLSAIFRHAKRMRAYGGDLPTDGVRLPALQAAEKRALTWPQVQAVAAAIGHIDPKPLANRGHRRWKPEHAEAWNRQLSALVLILAITGMRIGEAMGLRWKRVNLTGEPVIIDGELVPAYTLAVRENYVRGVYGTLKSKMSRRNIPLTTEAWYQFSRLQAAATSAEPDAPVFVSSVGTPLDQHNIAKRFLKPAAKRAGVPWASWHVLRHTAATLADQAGLSVSERQRTFGHASAEMQLHYTHAELERVRSGLELIGKETVQ
jgi:integrase